MLLSGTGLTRMVRCTNKNPSTSIFRATYCNKSIQGLLDLFQKAASEGKINGGTTSPPSPSFPRQTPRNTGGGYSSRIPTSGQNLYGDGGGGGYSRSPSYGQNLYGDGGGGGFSRSPSSGPNLYGDTWKIGGDFMSRRSTAIRVDTTPVISSKPVNRNYYQPHHEVDGMSPDQIAHWRAKMATTIEGKDCPTPILKFEHTPFNSKVKSTLTTSFPEPTIIQSQGWPVALSSRDMIGTAETGSGKTLAFILPAFEHIKAQPPVENREGPIALVLVPTRELAQQIESEALKYASAYLIRLACVFGGQGNRSMQLRQLSYRPQLVVATPGRLIDFINSGNTNLNRVSYLVLDEADRMLDMGFEPQIREIVNQIPTPDRQTLMWSATWPRKVQGLARDFFTNPIRVNIGSMELSANPKVNQKFIVCDGHQRYAHITNLINENPQTKTLIFVSTKRGCNDLGNQLLLSSKNDIRMAILHGDKTQIQRNNILSDFRKNLLHLVVATDVAARGIDVSDIERVINFDFPANIESYIHRIGRTARGGKSGESISFFTPVDFHIVKDLIDVLNQASQPIPKELQSILRNESSVREPSRNFQNRPVQNQNKRQTFNRQLNTTYNRQFNSSHFEVDEDEDYEDNSYIRKNKFALEED